MRGRRGEEGDRGLALYGLLGGMLKEEVIVVFTL